MTETPIGMGLRGLIPGIFDGNKNKFDQFLAEIKVYHAVNKNSNQIMNPYNKVMTIIPLIRGPNVYTWVMDQLDTAIQNTAQWGDTDVRIWDEFEKILKDTFEDQSKKENTFYDLEKLTMSGENLEEYITKFNHLLKKTGWPQNMEGAAIYFR